jgi:hypothetical protein
LGWPYYFRDDQAQSDRLPVSFRDGISRGWLDLSCCRFDGHPAYDCNGAGMPCPACNLTDEDAAPRLPAGFKPPSIRTDPGIKHEGYRLIVRRDGKPVRLFTRNGHDWTDRYACPSHGHPR